MLVQASEQESLLFKATMNLTVLFHCHVVARELGAARLARVAFYERYRRSYPMFAFGQTQSGLRLHVLETGLPAGVFTPWGLWSLSAEQDADPEAIRSLFDEVQVQPNESGVHSLTGYAGIDHGVLAVAGDSLPAPVFCAKQPDFDGRVHDADLSDLWHRQNDLRASWDRLLAEYPAFFNETASDVLVHREDARR